MGSNGAGPNIVLVVLDTLTAEAAGLGRSPAPMPHLASLAERGTVFTHAVSNAPWTYPSHASLFTGLLPSEHRMEVPLLRVPGGGGRFARLLREIERLSPKNQERLAERWLPRVFADAGYETVCVSNNPVVGPQTHMDHGFEQTVGVGFSDLFQPPKVVRRYRRVRDAMQAADYAIRARRGKQDLRAGAAVDRIRSWAGSRDGSRPFFLFVNLMEAHFPYFSPGSPKALREAGAGPVAAYRAMKLIGVEQSFRYNVGLLHDRTVPHSLRTLRALHRHAATYLDDRIRELHELSARDGRGLVVCVTSDHGDAFGEHQAVFHGITLDEPILHIPLVLAGDGVPSGDRDETVALRQVYATLLQAAGVEAPSGAAPSLLGDPPPFVVSERDRIDAPASLPPSPLARERLGRLRAVYRDPYKLVVSPAGNRLFDLSADPAESNDLAPSEPAVVEELLGALPPWPEGAVEPAGAEDGGEPSLSAREQDEIARQLAALGYLE